MLLTALLASLAHASPELDEGIWTIVASNAGVTKNAKVWVAKFDANHPMERVEIFCADPGFSWPTVGGWTWAVTKVSNTGPFAPNDPMCTQANAMKRRFVDVETPF